MSDSEKLHGLANLIAAWDNLNDKSDNVIVRDLRRIAETIVVREKRVEELEDGYKKLRAEVQRWEMQTEVLWRFGIKRITEHRLEQARLGNLLLEDVEW